MRFPELWNEPSGFSRVPNLDADRRRPGDYSNNGRQGCCGYQAALTAKLLEDTLEWSRHLRAVATSWSGRLLTPHFTRPSQPFPRSPIDAVAPMAAGANGSSTVQPDRFPDARMLAATDSLVLRAGMIHQQFGIGEILPRPS